MHILISGGSGLIGSALSASLIERGYDVVILSRNPALQNHLPAGVKVVAWDGVTVGEWARWVEGAAAVINLAGASIAGDSPLNIRWTSKRKQAILHSRVKAGNAIASAIRAAKSRPGALVQASAVGFYGPRQDEIVDEHALPGDDFLAQVVQQWEASTENVEEIGVRRIILRTGLVFAGKGGIFPLLKLPFSLFAGGPLGHGRQYLSWVHIEDLVKAVLHLFEDKQASGVYNLTAPEPLSNRDFARSMGKAMKRPAWLPAPAFAMKLALGEASMLALEGQRVVPKRLLDNGFTFQYSSIEDALPTLLDPELRFVHRFDAAATPEQVSAFHSDSRVLKMLTPFPIIVQFHHVEGMKEGSRAEFTLWFGPIPVRWNARHHDLLPGKGFMDTQVDGPFKYWVHRHSFLPVDEEHTQVVDEIRAQYRREPFYQLVGRFMWLTLPILFAYRAWRTRKALSKIE